MGGDFINRALQGLAGIYPKIDLVISCSSHPEIKELAHEMAGVALTLGANRLALFCRDLQLSSQNERDQQIYQEQIKKISVELEEVKEIILKLSSD